ncbi:MAG: sensor domain-containing diguanylate cyclase [Thermodesulfovibrio sp.]|nr:sensor domain-containing diguanylate cyclase [Thermodesulfovibrio sp.]
MYINETFLALLNYLYEGVYIIDKQRNIIFWNKSAEEITGYKSEEVLGRSCKDNILRHVDKNGNELCINGCPMVFSMENSVVVSDEVYLHHKSGYRLLVRVKGIPILKNGKEANGVIELFTPVLPTLDHDDLFNLALKDPLTKLYNRKGFDFMYPIRQREMMLLDYHTGVLFFDIDDFKKINDTYGHEAGDKVLYAISQIFINFLRHQDIVVRWGGEEFLAVIFIKDLNHVKIIGKKLIKLIQTSFIEYGSTIIKFTLSGGGTFLKKEETILETIKRADQLMYEAKRQGKNRFICDI